MRRLFFFFFSLLLSSLDSFSIWFQKATVWNMVEKHWVNANVVAKIYNVKFYAKISAPKVLNSFLWFISRIKLDHKKLINQIKKHYLQIFAEKRSKKKNTHTHTLTKECRLVHLIHVDPYGIDESENVLYKIRTNSHRNSKDFSRFCIFHSQIDTFRVFLFKLNSCFYFLSFHLLFRICS